MRQSQKVYIHAVIIHIISVKYNGDILYNLKSRDYGPRMQFVYE